MREVLKFILWNVENLAAIGDYEKDRMNRYVHVRALRGNDSGIDNREL